ncbi:hypothetical protein PJI17_32815 [Mycobacterium kansasii]
MQTPPQLAQTRFYAAQQDPQSFRGVIEGILPVSACIARVLFNSSASHLFMSENFYQ